MCLLACNAYFAGMKVPKKVLGHGFSPEKDKKWVKVLNVLDPDILLSKYGNDPVRWFLIKDISLGSDGDFQDRDLLTLSIMIC